jgi:hypothetical protein
MGKWLAGLFGGGLSGVGSFAKDMREVFKGKELDPEKQLEAATKIIEMQARINEVEAGHRSIFVAGWRPFIGWICGIALLYASIIEPLLRFIASQKGYIGSFPELDTTITMQVLLGILGLAGFRTWEKKEGVTK